MFLLDQFKSKKNFINHAILLVGIKVKDGDGTKEEFQNKFDSKKIIVLDAMRPEFRLGSLYDRRTDNLLPGFTFWKADSSKKEGFISVQLASNQQWLIDSKNSFSSKVWNLGIEAGLTLSLIGGLVDIKGHAKYLKDTTSSHNVAKVSLTYKETTVYCELTSDALYNLDYRDILTSDEKKNEFTHVVVGILYGGSCTMVFEREIKEGETKEDIEGALSVVLKSIPISGKAPLKLNNDEKQKVDDFKCTVYSDLKSNASVANWDEALSLYKSLPTKLSASGETEAKRGVPVKIWLLPKALLGSQHDTLVRELSSVAVNKTIEIKELLTEAINESCDLKKKTKKFPILNSKIVRFAKLVEKYRTTFQKDILSVLLVGIRSGTGDEKLLFDAVDKHERSAFGYLNIWIERIKEEVDNLLATQYQLSEECISFANKTFEQNIVKKIANVVFTLRVCKREDKFIDKMQIYYDTLAKNETTTSGEEILDILNKKKWFEDELLKEKMREMAYQMRTFASANQLNEDTGFIVREIECKETPDCCIDVWVKGKKLPFMSFEPPTEVRNLKIKKYSHDTMRIQWNSPEQGKSNISSYKMEVRRVSVMDEKDSSQVLDQIIEIAPAADETMIHVITNLRPGQLYQVSVQALCLNNYAFNKSETLCQMTRLSNPPIDFTGEVSEKRHIKLAWEKPTIKAESANLKGFIIEYKTTNGKWLLSNSVPSHVKSHSISNLSYGTDYRFRILACYDDEKYTLPSEDIKLKTESLEAPQAKKVNRYFCLFKLWEI